MRRLLFLAALAIALCGSVLLVSAAPSAPAVVSIGSATGTVGQPLTLTLSVADASNLGAFEATLSTTGLDVQSVSLGSFLGSSGRSTGLLPTRTLSDSVVFGAYSFGSAPGTSGTGTLASIVVIPRTTGTRPLTLTAMLTDPMGSTLASTAVSGELSVSGGLGDLNYDGRVDLLDIQIVAGRWMCAACYDPRVDFDKDGDIDIIDVQAVAGRWGTQY